MAVYASELLRSAIVQLKVLRDILDAKALSFEYGSDDYKRWQEAAEGAAAIIADAKDMSKKLDESGLQL